MTAEHPFAEYRKRVDAKLARFESAVEVMNEGKRLMGWRCYGDAIPFFERALDLFTAPSDKDRAEKFLQHCQRRVIGILDVRWMGLGIYYNDTEITEAQMKLLLNRYKLGHRVHGTALSRTAKKRESTRVTIRDLCYGMFDKYGLDVSLEAVLVVVLQQHPTSKFSGTHLAYYRCQYKKAKRSVAAGNNQKENASCPSETSLRLRKPKSPSRPSTKRSTKSKSSRSKRNG